MKHQHRQCERNYHADYYFTVELCSWQQGSKIKGDEKSMSRRNLYDVYKGKEKILSVVTAGQIEEKTRCQKHSGMQIFS